MKHENEIRRVIELQKQIKENQREVSKILNEINEPPYTGTKFVIDGTLWEIDRWPRETAITREYFSAWCLKNRGEVQQ